MRTLLLPLLALCLQAPAKADKFWLSDPAAPQNTAEGSQPDILEGVLIAESDEGYHIRVVGGEVLLPKKAVFRIEKDSLSIDAIVQQEQQAAQAAAAVHRTADAVPASATGKRTRHHVQATEASATKGADAKPTETLPVEAPPAPSTFDPVIGRNRPATTGATQAELMAELQLAWSLTHDKRYLTALRQMRRLR